jgi:electron transfer flavoprotein alpha subunit
MEKAALLVEFKAGEVKPAVFGAAALVRRSGMRPVGFAPAALAAAARAALGEYGVPEIVAIEAGGENPAAFAAAAAAAMQRLGIAQLVGLTTPQGRDLLPRIAARLEAPLVMDCLEVDLVRRSARATQYSGKTIARIELTGRFALYGLRPILPPAEKAPVAAEIVAVESAPAGAADGLELLERRAGAGEGADLAEAEVILAGGRGMKSGENFSLLSDCAHLIPGAAVGASRVAVDLGWVPYRMQVGQTGAKVGPKVYIACGISGSVQHFAGMKSAGLIIAVNSDPNAAIMAKCDYYAVADLFELLPELRKALAAAVRPDA